MTTILRLKDGSIFKGQSFGAEKNVQGEMVFTTGMTGYVESLTDPSYHGQILVMSFPLIGNYGVPNKKFWESEKIHVSGLIVSEYCATPSHHQLKQTLSQWLKKEGIPAICGVDTREIILKIRRQGAIEGKIIFSTIPFFKADIKKNFSAEVSTKEIKRYGEGKKTVLLIDCGVKKNIITELTKRKNQVIQVPWDFDPFEKKIHFDGLLISNGPGDPKLCKKTVETVKKVLKQKIPVFGICLGNQILALAGGGDTEKMKFGHRGQNQPVIQNGTKKCFLTTQNHGYHVNRIPKDFTPWFVNLNDQTNEGIIHKNLPFMSVQFHPESNPGPIDTTWIFDEFLKKI